MFCGGKTVCSDDVLFRTLFARCEAMLWLRCCLCIAEELLGRGAKRVQCRVFSCANKLMSANSTLAVWWSSYIH